MMASKESSGEPVCLVCLETHDTLKVVPVCKHVFCHRCLSKHLEKQGPSSESFPCPTCHVQSTLTEEGIDGFIDYDNLIGGDGTLGKEAKGSARGGIENSGDPNAETDECGTCRFTKGVMIKARALCDECGQLYLCAECTKIHAKNSATAGHVVKSLKSVKKKVGDLCKSHKKQVTSFCCTCSKPCCHLCVFLDHGDHDVKTIGDAFRSLVDDLNQATKGQEKRSSTLKVYERQLKILHTSEVSKRRDVLVHEIENHAEKCIEEIIRQKDERKAQVLTKFKFVTEVSEWINKLPTLQCLDKTVSEAKRVLLEADPHPDDLKTLSRMLQLVTDARIDEDFEERVDGYWDTYIDLLNNPLHFAPTRNQGYDIGTITVKKTFGILLSSVLSDFEKKLTVDNDTKFIPSLATLGNDLYAVAHPVIKGQRSNAIDIYKLSGELQQTISDHVPPFYDMVATPAREIAVLSDGASEGTCSVSIFDPDPEIGFVRSTEDFPVSGALSFDIDIRYRYAVLGGDGGKRVTLFNEDGSEVASHPVSEVTDASRIRCSARNVFIMGLNNISVYEQKGKDLIKMTERAQYDYKDIAVNHFNDVVTEVFNHPNGLYVESLRLQNNRLDRVCQKCIGGVTSRDARLSVGDGYIVVSNGHTFTVYRV
ncbi:uncharacterized protein LOC135500100 [Lineus longissimus]|uniref:uncharacterized protein LOC135500100 n=1 Tax=Lineus longissimus TaxID=88925 RepID=UPI002B4E4197